MPYLAIDDFKSGLDARKSVLTATAGSLTRLTNAVVTPGGEILKRRAFVKVATLTGTKGLCAVGSRLVAFKATGSSATAPNLGMDTATLEYNDLPNLSATAKQIDWDVFDGNLYVVFYDKTPPAPLASQSGAALPTGVKRGFVYKNTATGKKFIWQADRWNSWEEKSSGTPVTQVLIKNDTFKNEATGGNFTYNGNAWTQIVPTFSGSGTPTSTSTSGAVANDTYLDYSTKKLWKYSGSAWTAWAPKYTGSFFPVSPVEGDTFLDTATGTTKKYHNNAWADFVFDGTGTTLPTGIVQESTFKKTPENVIYAWREDAWVVWTPRPRDINPHYYNDASATPPAYVVTEGSGRGYYVRAYQSKIYTVNDKYIYFSAIKYPKLWEEAASLPPSGASPVSVLPITGYEGERVIFSAKKKIYTWKLDTSSIGAWAPSDPSPEDLAWIEEATQRTGAGYINTALQESGGKGLQGLDIYYDKLAVFSGETTQLWAMDPDPNQNALTQVLRSTGTLAPRSVQQYGSGDVLYLASSGIRSLKARDASNSAAVTDIGSPVDQIVRGIGQTKGRVYLANGQAVNEPITGRFWMVFPDSILVLSYFPAPKINAWSEFKVPFQIDYIVTAGDHIFIRSGDDLYLYGGKTAEEYDDCPVEVRFPYLDGGKPGHRKMFEAIDATVEGSWGASVSYNYEDQDAEEFLGVLDRPTWGYGRFALQGYSSHMSMRFYCTTEGKASLSNCAIHYKIGADED